MNHFSSETSVIIPTYNDKYEDLENAIQSVINQTLPPKEIIIVDDGSINSTASDVTKKIKKTKKTNIKLLKKENGGPSSARNLGLKHSSGKYISFLDSDDLMLPNNLLEKEKILRELSINYFGIYGSYIIMPGNHIHKHDDFDGLPNTDNIEKISGIPGSTPAFLFRKHALERVNGFDVEIIHNEDYDLIIRLIKTGMKCKGSYDSVFIRNIRPNSLSRNIKYFETYQNILRFLDKASKFKYFSEKELNKRYKNNEIFYAKKLIFNKKNLKLGFTHFNKAFSYSSPSTLKQIVAYILTKIFIKIYKF